MLFVKPKNDYAVTLALGGAFQTILLIKSLAKTGKADENAIETSINTIYKLQSEDAESIYGDFSTITLGLQEVVKFFDLEKKKQDPDIMRYLLSFIYLERKLMRNAKVRDKLEKRITQMEHQKRYFEPLHPTILSNLADIYSEAVSDLNYQIQIVGRATYLNRQDIIDKIRALLLAGLRSTVLWKQMGGNRWQLIFGRKQILSIAVDLCRESNR